MFTLRNWHMVLAVLLVLTTVITTKVNSAPKESTVLFSCSVDASGVCLEINDGRDTLVYGGSYTQHLEGVTRKDVQVPGTLTCKPTNNVCGLVHKLKLYKSLDF